MVGCGLACPGRGGARVSGCEFTGSEWGWDRRCQDRGLGVSGRGGGAWGTHRGGVATQNMGPYIYIYIHGFVFCESIFSVCGLKATKTHHVGARIPPPQKNNNKKKHTHTHTHSGTEADNI